MWGQRGLEDSVWREVRQRGGWLPAPKMKGPACRGHTARKRKPEGCGLHPGGGWGAGGEGQGSRAVSGAITTGV